MVEAIPSSLPGRLSTPLTIVIKEKFISQGQEGGYPRRLSGAQGAATGETGENRQRIALVERRVPIDQRPVQPPALAPGFVLRDGAELL
ncbi:MAG: hypothetical protein PHY92_09430 [Alphaproteobacteria bacterium]|nr:hypothetical protein [Alphaproteobacteria bacterium]